MEEDPPKITCAAELFLDQESLPKWEGVGKIQSWTSVRTGVLASRASVRDLVREDRKAMEEARSARCPKEQIQRGHADAAERRTG